MGNVCESTLSVAYFEHIDRQIKIKYSSYNFILITVSDIQYLYLFRSIFVSVK